MAKMLNHAGFEGGRTEMNLGVRGTLQHEIMLTETRPLGCNDSGFLNRI